MSERDEGAVALELCFAVGPHRNWVNPWKATIDSLDWCLEGPARLADGSLGTAGLLIPDCIARSAPTGATTSGSHQRRYQNSRGPTLGTEGSGSPLGQSYMRFTRLITMSWLEQSRHVSGRILKRSFDIRNALLQNGYRQPHDRVIHQSAAWSASSQNFRQMHGISVSKSSADRTSNSGSSRHSPTITD